VRLGIDIAGQLTLVGFVLLASNSVTADTNC